MVTSALSSNDSGHVSAGPYSLPSISSTKEMSIASSPPLDVELDHTEFSDESFMVSSNEFTKVTKKQRKKKTLKRSQVYPPGSHEAARATSQGPESDNGSGWGWTHGRHSYRDMGPVSGTKSTCSVPPSEASDTDDHDSVHSLPVGSTRTKVSVSVASVSSGHTPHASYADIARHAAALHTQQQGQQQHAVYREQLQFRETTPGNAKESVSSNDTDYFYNPDLDSSFPPVSGHVPDPSLSTMDSPSSSHNNNNNNNNPVTDSDNNNPSPHNNQTTQSNPNKLKRLSSGSNCSSDLNSNKAKLRQNKSDPSLLLAGAPPVVILQNDPVTETSESSGFTFGFEVRPKRCIVGTFL